MAVVQEQTWKNDAILLNLSFSRRLRLLELFRHTVEVKVHKSTDPGNLGLFHNSCTSNWIL